MVLDIFKPVLYSLERIVVGKIIPDASGVSNRRLLQDYPIDENDKNFDHSTWNNVLQRHIKKNHSVGPISGVSVVDYEGIAKDPDFKEYIDRLAEAKPEELSQPQQLAFWMNAYNAFCINLIVSHEKSTGERLKSINNLSKPKQPVWDMVAGQVDGKDISLNEIEHEKLRKRWAEPAVHGCIVCASASCPNIRSEAFVAERLREQMDDQVRDWLSNPTKGVAFDGKRVMLSRIFLWFEKDFGEWKGIRAWLPQYLSDEKQAQKITGGKVTKRYFEYDWSINRYVDAEVEDESGAVQCVDA